MPTLVLQFPGGRYHATPWGHHVNEGLIEWPPSPWRLLRALLSVGYSTLGWNAALDPPLDSSLPEVARSLITKLASVLPSYALPPAVGAHSRHYMPVAKFKGGREDTTLVFDTWAQIGRGELAVSWNVHLGPDELDLLRQIASNLGYLGRSESWVIARLVDEAEVEAFATNCHPCGDDTLPGIGWEQVSALAPAPAEAFLTWRNARVDAALSALPVVSLSDNKKLTTGERKSVELRENERRGAVAPFPVDLVACLHADTTWLREHGWSQPPGSRRVLYWRRADALQAAPLVVRPPSAARATASFVLLSLTSQSRNDHALPMLRRSLPQGEMLHRQMVAARLRLAPHEHARTLTGCDESGVALRGAHGHAHVLALDLDGDDHIDHLMVWAPDGLDELDQRALRMTRGTYTKGGVGPLKLSWIGAGEHSDMCRMPSPYGDALARITGSSRVWISVTPFVPPRHLKKHGKNDLEGQVRAELASRNLPLPDTVEWLDPRHDDRARRLRHHVRVRRYGKAPAVDIGFALRLSFAESLNGPLCLGYGSHFGLGRFECEQ